jgi:hypothetical protein
MQLKKEAILLSSILGWGFPPYLGGTLNFPEFVGVETFLSEADGQKVLVRGM